LVLLDDDLVLVFEWLVNLDQLFANKIDHLKRGLKDIERDMTKIYQRQKEEYFA
jgi:hypothetical protein